ncbi:hypothetical protein MTO96_015666 [Rhipicephalus appendiculatus]
MGQVASRSIVKDAARTFRAANIGSRRSPVASYSTNTQREIGVLGIPLHQGQRKLGVEEAPKFLRDAGLLDQLRGLVPPYRASSNAPGVNLGASWHRRRVALSASQYIANVSVRLSTLLATLSRDFGDVRVEGEPNVTDCNAIESDIVGKTSKNVRDAVAEVLRSGRVLVNLGGDHTMAIGTVSGHAQATHSDLAVIWVDAHADINTPTSSASGNIHGMAVAFLLHEMAPYVVKPKGFEWIQPCVHKENFAFIGLRDVDDYERHFLDQLGITVYDMADVDRHGIRNVVQRILNKINPTGTKSLHVSYDIDSLDKLVAPSTGTPVMGGLTLREGLIIAEEVSNSGQLRVLDLAEVNLRLGSKQDAENTLDCSLKVVDAFFGSQRRGNLPLHLDKNIVEPRHAS